MLVYFYIVLLLFKYINNNMVSGLADSNHRPFDNYIHLFPVGKVEPKIGYISNNVKAALLLQSNALPTELSPVKYKYYNVFKLFF